MNKAAFVWLDAYVLKLPVHLLRIARTHWLMFFLPAPSPELPGELWTEILAQVVHGNVALAVAA